MFQKNKQQKRTGLSHYIGNDIPIEKEPLDL